MTPPVVALAGVTPSSSTIAEYVVVFVVGAVAGGFAIPAGFLFGLSPPETYVAAAAGGITGAAAFIYAGNAIRERVLQRSPRRERATSRVRRLVDRYGVKGVGLFGPIFPGVTLSVVVGLSLGLPRRELAVWLSAGVAVLYALYTVGLSILVGRWS